MNCRNSHDLLGSLRLHRMDEVDACVISIRLALWDTFVIHFSTVRHSRAHAHYRDSIPTNAANNSRGKQIAWEVGLLADLSCCQLLMQKLASYMYSWRRGMTNKQMNLNVCVLYMLGSQCSSYAPHPKQHHPITRGQLITLITGAIHTVTNGMHAFMCCTVTL